MTTREVTEAVQVGTSAYVRMGMRMVSVGCTSWDAWFVECAILGMSTCQPTYHATRDAAAVAATAWLLGETDVERLERERDEWRARAEAAELRLYRVRLAMGVIECACVCDCWGGRHADGCEEASCLACRIEEALR